MFVGEQATLAFHFLGAYLEVPPRRRKAVKAPVSCPLPFLFHLRKAAPRHHRLFHARRFTIPFGRFSLNKKSTPRNETFL
jgi:hypothetical protein